MQGLLPRNVPVETKGSILDGSDLCVILASTIAHGSRGIPRSLRVALF